MQKILLMRGWPGSGKSRLAKIIEEVHGSSEMKICSADYFWIQPDGSYKYNPKRTTEAHTRCQLAALKALKAGRSVVVDNTNILRANMEFYIGLAEIFEVDCYQVAPEHVFRTAMNYNAKDGFKKEEALKDVHMDYARNTHNVPLHVCIQMLTEFEFESELPVWAPGND